MTELKLILNQPKLWKYSIVIVAAISGLWLWRSPSILTELKAKTQASVTLSGHKTPIYAVAISADGKTLTSSSHDGKIKVWNLTNGQLFHTINAHADAIESLVISPDGKIIASGSWDNDIKLWNITNGKFIQTLKSHADDVKAIAMSKDGQTLASGSYNGVIKIWNLKTGSLKMKIKEPHPIIALAFSPDGEILASGCKKGNIKTWELNTGKELHSFAAHTKKIWTIAFSPDGKILASGSQDQKVKLWEIEKGQLHSTLENHDQAVLSVDFSPDSKIVAGSSYDSKIHLWQVETGKLLETFTGHSQAVWSLKFTPDGQTLVSGSTDRTIKLWCLSSLNSQQLQNTTFRPVVKEEADKIFISEIIDTQKLEELNQILYHQINQSWQQTPTWSENLVYQATVNNNGVILSLEPINRSARDYFQQTPLPKLLNSSDAHGSHQKSFALFKTVMTPTGVLEVSPWRGWEN
ncbi:MAG: WD40 repeat domain-containing protein [Trichodesmium sp. St19_bin2]|nr:WD40 repeat domain-containing protein [Trichodesmium sp. St19_bin2]